MADEFSFEELARRAKNAREARPEVPPEELLFSLTGEQVETFAEVNARGEVSTFLCLRCMDSPVPPIPNCSRKNCARCGAHVWMSPATEESMNKLKNTRIVCTACVLADVKGSSKDGR